ncbi:MAG: hypothetical protein V7607_5416 [Solirubrobacteraceae bacterium]
MSVLVKVAYLNLLEGGYDRAAPQPFARLYRQIAILAEGGADVVGLGEIDRRYWGADRNRMYDEVAKRLGMDYRVAPGRGQYDNGVYWSRRLFDLAGHSALEGGAGILADLRLRNGAGIVFPFPLAVVVLHLDYASPTARVIQTERIVGALERYKAAFSVGDYNSGSCGDAAPDLRRLPRDQWIRHVTPDGEWRTEATDRFHDAGYKDLFLERGVAKPTAGFGPHKLAKRPDIAFAKAALASAVIDCEQFDGESDHQGLLVTKDLEIAAPLLTDMRVLETSTAYDYAMRAVERLVSAGLKDDATPLWVDCQKRIIDAGGKVPASAGPF